MSFYSQNRDSSLVAAVHRIVPRFSRIRQWLWDVLVRSGGYVSDRSSGHLRLAALVLLALVYMLPGIAGYGPWKPDEPYMFGMIHSLMQAGDWIVPTLAGEPFMEKPPLLMWAGAITAKLASPWLPVEHGARIAIGVFMLVALVSAASAARRWWGNGQGRYAVLGLIASLGLLQYGRMMVADVPLVAGIALACCGWAWVTTRPIRGGLLIGTGAGIAFMAKGLIGPGVLAVTAILLPVIFKQWRTALYARSLCVALLSLLPWLLIWPSALYWRSPALFMEWFWVNNVGRFLGFSVPLLGAAHESGHLLETLPWFTFPVLPLALWTFWTMRRQVNMSAPLQVCGLMFVVMFAVFWASASGRVVYLLPMLIPLAVAAVPAMTTLPRVVSAFTDWGFRTVFLPLIIGLWIIWLTIVISGSPPDWPVLAKHLPMNFLMHANYVNALVAFGLFVGWCLIIGQLKHIKARAVASLASGLIVVWGTAFLLLLPWIDAAKSYQSTFREMSATIPFDANCVASTGLGESERGMLHFVTGIVPRRTELGRGARCNVLVWQGLSDRSPDQLASNGWNLRWEGARPGENREHFWLFTRSDPTQMASKELSRSDAMNVP